VGVVGETLSIGAIFAWANRRMDAHWPGLFAIAIVVALVPMLRIVLEQGDPKALHPWVGVGFAVVAELAMLLGTAAIVLLAAGPDADGPTAERVVESARQALHDGPRLVAVWIAAALVRWIPALALARVFLGGGGLLTLIGGLLLLPLAFVCHVAFAGAVMERTGPFNAIVNAFHRASRRGLGLVVGLSLLVALVDQLPPVVIVWVANLFFPPALVHVTSPLIPQTMMPFPMTVSGRFGSGIPWQARLVMLLLYAPIRAYVAVLYAAAAVAFLDPGAVADDTAPIELPVTD
jgi:hypothetical protein